jgi:hypothetical protein
MHKISIIIRLMLVALAISASATAQRVEFYTLNMPSAFLEGGGKVFVKSLTNNGTTEADFGDAYAKAFTNVLSSNALGKDKDVKLYNPWLTTALYQVVGSEDEADFIISGDYIFESSSNSSYEEKFIKETSETVDKKLPISYYTFSANSSASLAGKTVITKKDGTAIGSIPFGNKKEKSNSKHMEKPSVPSTSSFIQDLRNEAINKTVFVYSPRLDVEKFKFNNVKTKNKEFKKELKDLVKQAEALVKTGDFNEAGKKYLEIAAKEDNEDVNCNIAVCYEIIGNFTKAKDYYVKSADKSGIKRINTMILVRDKLKELGIQVVENDF